MEVTGNNSIAKEGKERLGSGPFTALTVHRQAEVLSFRQTLRERECPDCRVYLALSIDDHRYRKYFALVE
jgi:hypothetical protein